MAITEDDVKHVAKLARLNVGDQELPMYTKQLDAILEYADKLNKLDTENIEPATHAIPQDTVFRQDKVKEFKNKEKIIQNGPQVSATSFVVPKII